MNSRKEEERNEKIIRGLLKLPPNRRCINCNSLGPQYVCTNFWTFICTACSGIHREFTHRVKSVSMAKFTTKEVEALQKGGNQRAREIFLSDWDFQRSRLPDSSNPDRIREFIRSVYVDKKYAGGRPSDKPPRGIQSHKNFEEEHRRASSYHSYSQSPPYDHQYEDRRYGKQTGILSRKPGSDRGLYEGKIANFICSPGRLGDQMYEDRFANEISGTRISDYSASSTGDTFKFDGQSPNFQSDSGYGSPQAVRDILIEDGRRHIPGSYSEASVRRNVETVPRPQRTASSGSFDSNSVSLKSVNSGSFQEVMIESELATAGQPMQASFFSGPQTSASPKPSNGDAFHPLVQNQANSSASSIDLFAEINQPSTRSSFVEKSLPQPPLHGNSGHEDPFGPPFAQNAATSSVPSLDLFAKINQPPSVATLEKISSVPFSQEEGWATFDVPHAGTSSQTKTTSYSAVAETATSSVSSLDKQGFDAFPLTSNNGHWLSAQNSISRETFAPAVDQWDSTSNEVEIISGPTCSQSQTWNAFDDSFGNFPQPPFGSLPLKSDVQVPPHAPPTVDPCMNLTVQEVLSCLLSHVENVSLMIFSNARKHLQVSGKDGLRTSSIDDSAAGMSSSLDNIVTGPSFNPAIPPLGANGQECKSTNPFDLPYESDLESSNGFLDMSSLQASLPPVQFPSPFLSGLGQPWYSQNAVAPYISSVTSGGLAYVAGQSASTQLPDMPPQGPVAPLGGNPFA